MGQTLENGVYLPSEGERNCYAGLKTNWEILDQKVADVTALQQAVAGVLHREIVESLPTTDIDPNTIYMILSGTSATENVYNEYMYVNNAWELIGTSATDLTNYYTKSEVDGKLLLKANDSDVVHKSGDETIGGKKTFRDDLTIYNYDSSQNTKNLNISSSKIQVGDTSNSDAFGIRFNAGASFVAQILAVNDTTGTQNLQLSLRTKDGSGNFITSMVRSRLSANGNSSFEPGANDSISLGSSSFKWKSVYATNYYYGSNNTEFSDKFVTTDTNQTISGAKTFSDNLTIYNSDDTQTPKGLIIRNAQWGMGESGGTTVSNINFLDKNSAIPVSIMASKGIYGQSFLRFSVRTKDSQNNTYLEEIYYNIDTSGSVSFRSWHDNTINLGSSIYKWKDVQTYLVNGVEPSSLSLPSDRSARIDISSYFTNTGSASTNDYSVPANGYISLNLINVNAINCYSLDESNTTNYAQSYYRPVDGQIYIFFPVRKNDIFRTFWITSGTVTVTGAHFIPCQGNV